jgi:hypothetical protein
LRHLQYNRAEKPNRQNAGKGQTYREGDSRHTLSSTALMHPEMSLVVQSQSDVLLRVFRREQFRAKRLRRETARSGSGLHSLCNCQLQRLKALGSLAKPTAFYRTHLYSITVQHTDVRAHINLPHWVRDTRHLIELTVLTE